MWRASAPPLDSEAIRQARVRKFLSQQAVADQLAELGVEIDRSTVSNIERGRTKHPPLQVIPALAEVLGMEVDDMFKASDGEPVAVAS